MDIARRFLLFWYRKTFQQFGEMSWINPTSYVARKNIISIGAHVFIGKKCHISIVPPSRLEIGDWSIISPYVKILGGDHDVWKLGQRIGQVLQGLNEPIKIEADTMLGMDSMVLKGVVVGEGAVVGAKSVVTKNILPYTIAVGNPARMIKLRFPLEDLKRHMDAVGTAYRFEDLLDRYREEKLVP